MELMFSSRYVGAQLQVLDDRLERLMRVYFAFHLRAFGRRAEVEFYKLRENRSHINPLYFHLKLPFVSLFNDVAQEVITSGTSQMSYVVPVTTGKVFGKSIYRIGGVR